MLFGYTTIKNMCDINSSYNVDKVLVERGNRYGKFKEHAMITQNIKRVMVDSPNWSCMSDDKKEALEMCAHKIGRILNGDPDYKDSWTDIIGYVKLVEDSLIAKPPNEREYDSLVHMNAVTRILSAFKDSRNWLSIGNDKRYSLEVFAYNLASILTVHAGYRPFWSCLTPAIVKVEKTLED